MDNKKGKIAKSIVTLNNMGRTSDIPSEYSQYFIDFSTQYELPVLDIGAAFGVASIPALLNGAKVIAVDLSKEHLDILRNDTPNHLIPNLTTIVGSFPKDLDFKVGSLSAIHASNLLNFLTGEEINQGLSKMFEWLCPGGKVFIISGTPYARNTYNFIPTYETRKNKGVPWPGEINDLSQFSDDITMQELPNFLHLLDDEILTKAFKNNGFKIEKAEMYKRANVPDYISLDGRENVGIIALKPEN